VTALAQGTAGLALVTCFGLLGTRQLGAASILLAVQSLATAVAALAQHQPLVAAATAVIDLIGATWFLRRQSSPVQTAGFPRWFAGRAQGRSLVSAHGPGAEHLKGPVGETSREWSDRPRGSSSMMPFEGVKLGIIAGTGVAILCQSCGPLALPLAVALLSVLLAATRHHPLLRLVALVSLQNGCALAACLLVAAPVSALACFVLVLPFAVGLILGHATGREPGVPLWLRRWLGWQQVAMSAGMFAVSLTIPLDPLAAVFAPLIAAGGVAEAWAARNRIAQSLARRAAALAKLGFMLVAVGTAQPMVAWLAIVGAITAAMFPILRRGSNGMLLALCAAGLGLIGLLTPPVGLAAVSYTALFVGYAGVAAAIPELGVVVVIRILRSMAQANLPPTAGMVLISVALAGLLGCALLLTSRTGLMANRAARRHAPLTQLAQTSLAALAVGLGVPEARFAAVVLLILLILTRAAVAMADGPLAAAARAAMGGIPPLGVFPALVLVLLAINGRVPWLLLPVGLSLAAVAAASLPARIPPRLSAGTTPNWRRAIVRSVGLVPLALAFLFGFFAPDGLVDWLRAATAGTP